MQLFHAALHVARWAVAGCGSCVFPGCAVTGRIQGSLLEAAGVTLDHELRMLPHAGLQV